MRAVPALVSYHSVHWIRGAVESYAEQFPEDHLLVVANNPRRGERGWRPDCERERRWLAAHPFVELIDGPPVPSGPWSNRIHGAGVDVALEWCRARGADVLVHLEPDCLVTGRQWRDNLLGALAEGAWMAGSFRQPHGPTHPTPSAWLVSEVQASFRARQWRGGDEGHPRFRELVDLEVLWASYAPLGLLPRWGKYWDTGEKAWFEVAVRDRAALVETPGFRHYWFGTTHRLLSERTLLS